jgi:peptidoglycan-associated lipoprotein
MFFLRGDVMRAKFIFTLMVFGLAFTGCCRKQDEVWDDAKTCGRHMKRGVKCLGGKHGDSRQVRSREDFMCVNAEDYGFIPLPDEEIGDEIAMANIRPAKDPDPSLPGIDGFSDPSLNPKTQGVFSHIHFDLNSNLVKGKENTTTLRKVAEYLKKYPNTWIYVEGHCDERGAEAYNLALGARRANTIRTQLVQEGVDPDKIYTVSYGKERPIASGHNEDAWSVNRRAEFKVFQR